MNLSGESEEDVDSWIKAINSAKLQITESDEPIPSSAVVSNFKDIPELGDDDEQTQLVPLNFMSDAITTKDSSVIDL